MKVPKQWQRELDLAQELLSEESGNVQPSPHDYEVFRYTGPGVLLIFYPHRTTAQNYHIRVRDGGSEDKQRADQLMRMLDDGAGFNCTFTRKAR